MIETGGHRDISSLPEETIVILDIKTPSSGEAEKHHWPNLARLGARDAVKFVLGGVEDYDYARTVIRDHELEKRCHVLLSPSFGVLPPHTLVEWMLRDGLHARLNLQLHKFVWSADARGV